MTARERVRRPARQWTERGGESRPSPFQRHCATKCGSEQPFRRHLTRHIFFTRLSPPPSPPPPSTTHQHAPRTDIRSSSTHTHTPHALQCPNEVISGDEAAVVGEVGETTAEAAVEEVGGEVGADSMPRNPKRRIS